MCKPYSVQNSCFEVNNMNNNNNNNNNNNKTKICGNEQTLENSQIDIFDSFLEF